MPRARGRRGCRGGGRRGGRSSGRGQCGDLALAGVVDRLAEHARGLLRRVEPHAVLGGDEVEPPLRSALQVLGGGELVSGRAARPGRRDRVEQADERLAAAL